MSDPGYRVEFTATARKQLARLDTSVQTRILKVARLLAAEPRPPAARRLKADSELWRVRVGDYRVVYSIEGDRLVVAIARVGHRSSVYRGLGDI